MGNKTWALIFLLCAWLRSAGQDYKFVYYLDQTLNATSKQKAVIIGKAYEKSGHLMLDGFLKTTGKLIITASVKDSTLGTLQGLFRTYFDNAAIESEGNYTENEMDGVWKYWDKQGLLTDSAIYKEGVRIAYGTYKYNFSKPTLKQLFANPDIKDTVNSYIYSFTDSLLNTFVEKEVGVTDGKEKINFEVSFIGSRGLLKRYDSTGAVKIDSVFSRELREAKFIGGEDAWRNFLRKTLNASTPAINGAPAGKYTVILKFIVSEDGRLDKIKPENNPGYGMADEGMRVLKLSPPWVPAIMYGKHQEAYRRQPITFLVEADR